MRWYDSESAVFLVDLGSIHTQKRHLPEKRSRVGEEVCRPLGSEIVTFFNCRSEILHCGTMTQPGVRCLVSGCNTIPFTFIGEFSYHLLNLSCRVKIAALNQIAILPQQCLLTQAMSACRWVAKGR